jgi:hypothetical protein
MTTSLPSVTCDNTAPMLITYNFEIIHRPGRQHGNADGLSRRPCFPCNYCSRQDQKEMNSSSNETIEHLYRTKKQESKSTPSLDDDNFMFWFQHTCCLPGRWIISKLYVLSIWSRLAICPSGFLNLSSHVNEP